MKDKTYDHLNGCRKTFAKIQHPFMIKTQQRRYKGNIPQRNKAIYDKLTASIILSSEK